MDSLQIKKSGHAGIRASHARVSHQAPSTKHGVATAGAGGHQATKNSAVWEEQRSAGAGTHHRICTVRRQRRRRAIWVQVQGAAALVLLSLLLNIE